MSTNRSRAVIGILGGMGPMATVETFRRITIATPAATDQEHLHVIVDSDPAIPDRTEALVRGGPSPLPRMLQSAERLVSAGAGLICLPCNTAHAYYGSLQAEVPVPIVHMVDEAATVAAATGRGPFGLLATAGTVQSGVYGGVFGSRGLEVLTPDGASQRAASEAIRLVKAARTAAAVDELVAAAQHLVQRGAKALILGCTEISLLASQLAPVAPLVDALQAMVDATVGCATGRHPMPAAGSVPGPRDGVDAGRAPAAAGLL